MHRQPNKPRQGGFTLIEVLVTVLILSIGLLGIAALQTATVRGNQSALFRSQAAALGHQAADAMRANRDAARAGDYNTGFADDVTGTCTAATSAQQCDLIELKAAVDQRLPGGQARVNVNNATSVATVCIRWQEPQRANDVAAAAEACGGVPADRRQFEFQTEL